MTAPASANAAGHSVAQIQLTEQPPTAVDWLLDAVESQPPTAEQFIVANPGLSAEQAAAIQRIYVEYEQELQLAVNAYLEASNLLNTLVQPETTNEAIAQVRTEVVDHERRVYDLLFQRAMAIRAVLTPEQRVTVNTQLRSLLSLGTPMAVSTFPAELIGQPAEAVLERLLNEGWQLSVRTPRTLLFDKPDQTLDLVIDEDLKVEEAVLTPRQPI